TSKNASPVMGMDKKGITALIRSALATEPMQFDVGHNLDVMLHESAVKGEEGMQALKSLLAAYEAGGGVSIHFNIMDAETLRDAQENPQNYKNLQIRVCGWNTLWNDMPKSEQDKYIERAEALAD
ncbi:MAG: formate acetyltransferase, partial [Clostridia bacterium]|nr:formate acetyltransferase [Clostridia bacterium]